MIDGLTSGARRKEIQRRFNTDPAKDPLRILLATDAAREGLNFQAHCADLFHFDLPWNPGRIEQRNGRIDRKLQPADEVRCHYFVYPQRAEDRVLEVLVTQDRDDQDASSAASRRSSTTTSSAGSGRASATATPSGWRARSSRPTSTPRRKRITEEELEAARERQEDLKAQIERCQTPARSARAAGSASRRRRSATRSPARSSCSAPSRSPRRSDEHGRPVWTFPPLDRRAETDPSWAATLDTLRAPRKHEPEARRLAPRGADPAGRLRGRGRAHRGHRPPAPRAARRPAPARPLPLAGLHPPRPLARLPRAGRRLDPARRSCSAGCRSTARAPSGCTRSSCRSPRAGSSRRSATGRSAPTRARPRRRRSTCSSASLGDRGAPHAWRRRSSRSSSPRPPATSRSCCRSSSRAPRSWRHSRSSKLARARRARGEGPARDARAPARARARGARQARARVRAAHARLRRRREAPARGRHALLAHAASSSSTASSRREPQRIREFYEVRAKRVEPVGLVYLWPETN